jgi:hypothetical protein
MTLKLKLREGIESFLEEENAKIVQFSSDHYEAAKEYVDKFGNEKIEMLRQDHGKDVADMVLDGVAAKREKLLEGLAGNNLNVKLIVNNDELYVPVGLGGGSILEDDIHGYLRDVMLAYNGDLREGSFNRFVSFDAGKHISALKIDDLPEAFGLSNIKFCHDSFILPQVRGVYSDIKESANHPYVELKITPDSSVNGYINVNKEAEGFFPGYKQQFILDTDVKPFVMHLTSAPAGTSLGDNMGGYICHPRSTEVEDRFLVRVPDSGNNIKGSFLRWHDAHTNLEAGDLVKVYRLGDEHYRLEA